MAYLQRTHNTKSVKPLGQINLVDSKTQIYVHVQNSGLGPLIIDKLTFIKDSYEYKTIDECMNIDPKSYWHMLINETVKKVILPNSHFIVFEKNIEKNTNDQIEEIRKQLAVISLKVNYRDIYDNKFIIERDLNWFSRYTNDGKN